MHSRPDFIRPGFKRSWDHRKIDRHRPLIFREEAERYLSLTPVSLSISAAGLSRQIVSHMGSYQGQPIISAIPCFALERPDLVALSRHVEYISREGGHVVVLVNGAAPELQQPVGDLVEELRDTFRRHCPSGSFSVAGIVFDAPKAIGEIRAILNDAIVFLTLQHGVADPVIISNDADVCCTPAGYARTIRQRFSDLCVDILSGPLFYGYSPSGEDYFGLTPSMPDLFLGNRILEAYRLSRLAGYFYQRPFFTTEGPHTAFRASAYCAANGYDSTLEQAEDDELGIAIFALRQMDGVPFPSQGNAVYDHEFWLATNPRRQMLAIANGLSITDTWRRFPIKARPGYAISHASSSVLNRRRLNAVQLRDLGAILQHGSGAADSWRKVVEIFLRGIEDQDLTEAAFSHYLTICGVIERNNNSIDAAELAINSEPTSGFRDAIDRFMSNAQADLFEEDFV